MPCMISENASEKEKIKAEFNDQLVGWFVESDDKASVYGDARVYEDADDFVNKIVFCNGCNYENKQENKK